MAPLTPIEILPEWLHGYADITREEAETQVASLTESLRERQWLQADIIASVCCVKLAAMTYIRNDSSLYTGWPGIGPEWARKLCRLGRLFPPDTRDYDKSFEWYLTLAQLAQEASGIRYASKANQWNEISDYAVQMYGNLADEKLDDLQLLVRQGQQGGDITVPGMTVDAEQQTFTMEIIIRGDGKLFFDDGHGISQPFSAKLFAQILGPGRYTLVGVTSKAGDDVPTANR
jgi:hypothetical protein